MRCHLMTKSLSIRSIKELIDSFQTIEELQATDLLKDERKGVQKLIQQFEKRLAREALIKEEHLQRLSIENKLRAQGFQYIAGIDEVGRGPLAGPVVTAAVILPEDCDALMGVNDSKQLNHEKRAHFVDLIKATALAYSITVTSVAEIDQFNIYEATRRSMLASVQKLTIQPDFLLLDAMKIDSPLPQASIIKGDQRSLTIAAASILAKEYRDQLMIDYGKIYPEFGFEKHMGYGTKTHLDALAEFGYTPIHRQSFSPVAQTLKIYNK